MFPLAMISFFAGFGGRISDKGTLQKIQPGIPLFNIPIQKAVITANVNAAIQDCAVPVKAWITDYC